ncbi:MAG: ATP-grasp domain-containing protein [Candidatus Bathyarchaeia archaeon]
MRKQDPSALSGLKVGVLFNLPTKPSRGEEIDYIAEAGIEDQVEAVQDALMRLDLQHQLFPLEGDVEALVRALKLHKPDVVINLCEGVFGDSHLEMYVPSLLELLGIPYTGSPPLTLGLCQDKSLTKDILKANEIPTPKYRVLSSLENWRGEIDYPLFVKPLREDASLGISRESFVRGYLELKNRVEYINKRYMQPALVEEYVEGRELNVAVFGNEEPTILPISEILFDFVDEPRIVDYSAKWLRESDEYRKTKPVCPAKLEQPTEEVVERVAVKSYRVLGCRDYARVDIRLKGNIPYVLEVNPNPDISPDAGFARSLKAAGISYEEFVKTVLSFALERKKLRLLVSGASF